MKMPEESDNYGYIERKQNQVDYLKVDDPKPIVYRERSKV